MKNQFPNKVIQGIGVLIALIGLITLTGWFSKSPLVFSTFYSLKIVPAPSSALIFVLYGIAIFLYAPKAQNRLKNLIGTALGFIGVLISFVLFFLFLNDIRPQVEHFGLTIASNTPQGLVFGHMSPITAFCFVLSGLMLTLLFSSFSGIPWRRRAVFWFALTVGLINFIMLLIYLAGGNLFYGNNIIISPALLTILLFMVITIVWLWA